MPEMPSKYHMSTTTTDLERPAPGAGTLESEVVAPPPVSPSPDGADKEPKRRLSFVRRHPKGIIGLLLLLILVGLLGFAAYATSSYADTYDGKILPGATIAGVDVGGMDRDEAIAAVKDAIGPQFDRKVRVTWRKQRFSATAEELGGMSNAKVTVEEAIAESDEASFFELAEMRLLGRGFDYQDDVALRFPKGPVREFIGGVAKDFNRAPKDAELVYPNGWIKIDEHQNGREVKEVASTRSLLAALENGSPGAELEVKSTKPEVTAASFKQALLLHQGEFKVYFYERVNGKLKITHSWPVAVGSGGYPTPTGEWTVVDKVMGPSWTNPDPNGWGASMPDYIPPGPSNPLGVAAVYWDASGIRFHGTSDIGSIGTPASHGCVRMYNEDVTELYDMVEVGTPIISIY